MIRQLLAVLFVGLSLSACSESDRFAETRERDEPYMPMPQRPPAYVQAVSYNPDSPAFTRERQGVVAAPARREGDPLPDAYYESAMAAYAANERITGVADSIIVEKAAHRMTLLRNGRILRRYRIALGDPYGDKERTGDRKTPIGNFTISCRNDVGESSYHRSLCISYGHAIMIHGLPTRDYRPDIVEYHPNDWTAGCIALTNEEMDEVWRMVGLNTPITIRS